MTYDPAQVAFCDTETTGLDPEYHVVWEIAVIADGHEHVWQQQVGTNARKDADETALQMTGFRDRYDSASALTPHDSIARFDNLVAGRHLVGARPWSDSERLHRLHRAFIPFWDRGHTDYIDKRRHPWHYHLIDIETLAVGALAGWDAAMGLAHPDVQAPRRPQLPWNSRELSAHLNVDPDLYQPSHTALADTRWAKAVFEAVMGPPKGTP